MIVEVESSAHQTGNGRLRSGHATAPPSGNCSRRPRGAEPPMRTSARDAARPVLATPPDASEDADARLACSRNSSSAPIPASRQSSAAAATSARQSCARPSSNTPISASRQRSSRRLSSDPVVASRQSSAASGVGAPDGRPPLFTRQASLLPIVHTFVSLPRQLRSVATATASAVADARPGKSTRWSRQVGGSSGGMLLRLPPIKSADAGVDEPAPLLSAVRPSSAPSTTPPAQLSRGAIGLVLLTEFMSAVLNGMQGTSFQLVVTLGLGLPLGFLSTYYVTLAVASTLGHAMVPTAVRFVSPRTLIVATLLMLLIADLLQAAACAPPLPPTPSSRSSVWAAALARSPSVETTLVLSAVFRALAGLRGPVLFVWWSISIPSEVQPRFIGLQNGAASAGNLISSPLLAAVSAVLPAERDVGLFCGWAGVLVHTVTSVLIAVLIEPRSVQQAMRERPAKSAGGDGATSHDPTVATAPAGGRRSRACLAWAEALISRVPLLYVVLITKGALLYGVAGAWSVTTFAVALQAAYGLSLSQYALVQIPAQLCGALAPGLFVLLNERVGFLRIALLANAVSFLGLLKIDWVDPLTPMPLPVFVLAMSAMHVSNSLLSNLSHSILMNRAPPDRVANLSTINFFCFTLGLLIAAAVATSIYELASAVHPMLGPVTAFLGALLPVYLTNLINICCFGRYLFRRI